MARQTLLYQIILGCKFTILNFISINRYLGIFINFSLISIFVLFFMLRFSKHKLQGYKNLYMLKCMHVSQNGSVFIKDIDIKPILCIYNEVRPKQITVILYINYDFKNQRIFVYSLGFFMEHSSCIYLSRIYRRNILINLIGINNL